MALATSPKLEFMSFNLLMIMLKPFSMVPGRSFTPDVIALTAWVRLSIASAISFFAISAPLNKKMPQPLAVELYLPWETLVALLILSGVEVFVKQFSKTL
jgi:hypothetical protein